MKISNDSLLLHQKKNLYKIRCIELFTNGNFINKQIIFQIKS